MVFLVLFVVKTYHFLGTDSLSGHRKETGKKKQQARLSTIYPKTTLRPILLTRFQWTNLESDEVQSKNETGSTVEST